MLANVTVKRLPASHLDLGPVATRREFSICGDSKVLLNMVFESDDIDIAEMFEWARQKARRTEGATYIRHGLSVFNI